MRLTSDFFVAALLRRCASEGADAVLGRRGAAQAGAIFIRLDLRDGRVRLYGPAPQTALAGREGERLFARLHRSEDLTPDEAQARMTREIGFDPDLWLVEIEDRQGRVFVDLV
ncbi:MAG: DUF1491 family protein [Methylobacteriaceae bacterium]|nr:DUF1491 family protein [Methylobacteriaceae bacterium]